MPWHPAESEFHVPQTELPPGWTRPQPENLPRPTYWPSVVAFGAILAVWGVVTTWVMSVVGVVLCAVAFRGWIRELLREE
jgi:hypothetical protein